jgi:glycosyltransferase involved in cell wall biosynthesis
MKKINILILTPFFYPHVGGSQQYMEELYAALIKKYKNVSVEVLCYNTDNVSSIQTYRGIKITRVNSVNILKGQFAIPNIFSLINFLYKNKNNYDLIHCSTRFFDTSWWGPWYADHCAFHPTHQNFFISMISRFIDLSIAGFSLNYFDKVITTNKATQKFIKDIYNLDSEVIYGGSDFKTFKPSKKNNKQIHIVFIGRMIHSKGVRLLFNYAINNLKLKFTFAGPGYLKEELRNTVKDLRLKNIEILGKLTKKEVANLMRDSDILVHPSFHSEGFPNILTEAGASQLAVIATDSGGSGEVIINKRTGLLIDPRNQEALNKALDLLTNNKKLRGEYAKNLYKHVRENFNWEKAADLQYKLIQSLVS